MKTNGLPKSERIVSRRQIDALFTGTGSHGVAAFPVRAVYIIKERARGAAPVQLLVSVPKRHLRHAVDRNRVKRQLREAYRHRRQELLQHLDDGVCVSLALIWLSPQLLPSAQVEQRVATLLQRIARRLPQAAAEEGERP